MTTISITIDDGPLQKALDRLAESVSDMTPAMRKTSQALAFETDRNFMAEGRPRWKPLSGVTKKWRQGKRKTPPEKGFRILQHTGRLAGSVTTRYDAASAVVGTNTIYGAIHQFGGKAGTNRKVTIPARPYLPVVATGELQPQARQEILDTVLRHLRSTAGI